mgnify:CR=1 FL=1
MRTPEKQVRHAFRLLAAAASLGLSAARLPAQNPSPEVELSASAGFTRGGPLWSVAVQPMLVPLMSSVLRDTFALTRRLSPGLSAWLGVTKYNRPHVGMGAEVAWVAAGVATGCQIVGRLQPDPNQANAGACLNASQHHMVTSAITAQGTITLRAAPRRDVFPYMKVGLGAAMLSGSFVVTGADFTADACRICCREIYAPDSRTFTWAGTLAAGLVFGGGTGAHFRIEVRDIVLGLPVVTGPANPLSHSMPPVRIRAAHRVILALGFDLASGGPRRRRY